tara:strand:- start:23551 stop:24942 length:1392 start_codon:yes stop_codon:yes gene_type:complete
MINLISKFSQSNKINKLFNLLKYSTILSLPSFLGIVFAIIAIPVHLQINGKSDYGNYIFFHFIISFGLLLNIGINKIVAVELAKRKFVVEIIKQSLKLSLNIIFIITIISVMSCFIFEKYYNIFTIGIGLSITVIYLTLDGILQGFKKFKLLSIVNFIFYTLSLNIPSICLILDNTLDFENLIIFSIFLKIFSIITILIYIKKFYKIEYNKNSKYNFITKFKKYSKWYSLHMLNLQIFDFMDKYLIKIFIGPVALAIYSIPYQLAGKLTILSKSISAVLLPEISYSNEKVNFNHSLNIFTFIIPLFILIIFPFLDEVLVLWLKDQYSIEILYLTKIFLIVAWVSGISHILITYFEAKKKIKFNTILELYFLFPFLLLLFYILFEFKNLILISFVLLLKECALIIFRTNKIKQRIDLLSLIYLNILIVVVNLIINIYYNEYFYYSFISLVLFNSFLIIKKNLKK